MDEFKPIKSLDELKALFADGHEDETCECFIDLGLARSWKDVSFDGEDTFWVLNEIDESEQTITSEELFNENITLIGKAINEGKFYFAWF